MRLFSKKTFGGRRGFVAAAATAVLATAGIGGITLVFLTQHHAPEPPLTTSSIAPVSSITPTSPPTVVSQIVGPVLPMSLPTSISIPALGVQTRLLRLGQTATGALAVPVPGPDYNLPGWYEYSPTPGTLGPAVIAGHVDSAADGPSLFYRLGALKRGQTVLVTRSDGRTAIFTIDDVRRYSKSQFPTALVYGNTNHAALRLITCGGPFNSATGHYEDNVIVWASLTSVTGAANAAG